MMSCIPMPKISEMIRKFMLFHIVAYPVSCAIE